MGTRRPAFAVAGALAAIGTLLGCADTRAPAWDEGAELSLLYADDTSLTVAWPAADDSRGVTAYRALQGGEVVDEITAGEARELTVEGLAEFTEAALAVVAVDEAGNESAPLVGTFRTADVSAPRWGRFGIGCDLGVTFEAKGEVAQVALSWCEATDNDRIDHFLLERGEEEVGRAKADEQLATIEVPEIAGRYTVRACDPSGNCGRPLAKALDEEGRDIAKIAANNRVAMDRQIAENAGILAALMDVGAMDGVFGVGSAFDTDEAAWGGLIGSEVGEAYGAGGLGLAGVGSGGGGTGEGLGGLGTVGMVGSGGGGSGYGRGGSTYRAPSASVSGGEPALVAHAQRRLSRIEHCYTNALFDDTSLAGSVTATLSAGADGAVTVDGVTGIGGGALTSCVATALRGRLGETPGAPLSGAVTIQLDPGSK